MRGLKRQRRRSDRASLDVASSPKAVAILRRALEDPDFEVRYNGAVGLAEIFNEAGWRPSMEGFKSDESKYVSHWSERLRNQ